MPQARGGDGKPTSDAETTSGRAQSRRGRAGSTASSGRSSGRATSSGTSANSPDAGFEASAKRIRNLNERILEAGKQTGEVTLSAYEKALKAIATAVERGPGRSDIDWIAQLATAQAKFIREMTDAWTSAARAMLK
jgi:hypothetical protein